MEGAQFHTEIAVGAKGGTKHRYSMMLDSGSGVNSTTEELVVQVLNRAAEEGIPLSDRRHPVVRCEKWPQRECIRVAAGSKVRLLGAVVLNVTMLEVGKSTGPDLWIRFKICECQGTDWVGFILGGFVAASLGAWNTRRTNYAALCGSARAALTCDAVLCIRFECTTARLLLLVTYTAPPTCQSRRASCSFTRRATRDGSENQREVGSRR